MGGCECNRLRYGICCLRVGTKRDLGGPRSDRELSITLKARLSVAVLTEPLLLSSRREQLVVFAKAIKWGSLALYTEEKGAIGFIIKTFLLLEVRFSLPEERMVCT